MGVGRWCSGAWRSGYTLKGPICKIPNLSDTDALGREFGPPLTESVSIWRAGFPSSIYTPKFFLSDLSSKGEVPFLNSGTSRLLLHI